MKFLYIPLLCVLTAQFSFAQSRKIRHSFRERSWFSLNGGFGCPIQDYGSTFINNSEAGFAKTGFLGKIDLGIKLHRSFGICVSAVGSINQIDEHPFELLLPDYPGVTKEVITTPWKYIGGMGGLYMVTPVGRGALMLKGQLGYVSATAFSLEMLLSDGNRYERLTQSSAQTNAVIVDLGVTGIIPFSEVAFLNLSVDYINCSPEFNDVSFDHTSSFSNPTHLTFDYKMEMKQVGITMGVLWQF